MRAARAALERVTARSLRTCEENGRLILMPFSSSLFVSLLVASGLTDDQIDDVVKMFRESERAANKDAPHSRILEFELMRRKAIVKEAWRGPWSALDKPAAPTGPSGRKMRGRASHRCHAIGVGIGFQVLRQVAKRSRNGHPDKGSQAEGPAELAVRLEESTVHYRAQGAVSWASFSHAYHTMRFLKQS